MVDVDCFDDIFMGCFLYNFHYLNGFSLSLTKNENEMINSCFVVKGNVFKIDVLTKFMAKNIFKVIDENYDKIVKNQNVKQVLKEC